MSDFTIDDVLSRESRAWMPQDATTDSPPYIIGTVAQVSSTSSDYSDVPVPVILLVPDKPKDGTEDPYASVIWRVTCYQTVLANELAALRPKRGMHLGIRYEGRTKKPDGSPGYHKYRAASDDAMAQLPEVDWEALLDDATNAAGVKSDDPDPFG